MITVKPETAQAVTEKAGDQGDGGEVCVECGRKHMSFAEEKSQRCTAEPVGNELEEALSIQSESACCNSPDPASKHHSES